MSLEEQPPYSQEDFSRFAWHGWPAASHFFSTSSVTITAPPLCDWWRTPLPRFINRREGPFLAFEFDGSRNFEAGVWISAAKFDVQYNQGALLLHAGSMSDERSHWMKCGAEYESGHEYVNCVVASPWCDVATSPSSVPLSALAPTSGAVWIQVSLSTTAIGRTLAVRFTLRDQLPADAAVPRAAELTHLRDFPAFGIDDSGKLTEQAEKGPWHLGLMTAGLADEQGAHATFTGFRFRYLEE
ncbi:hypothetical protein JCM6882_004370 [Rhodosporidiobolus microsporus]